VPQRSPKNATYLKDRKKAFVSAPHANLSRQIVPLSVQRKLDRQSAYLPTCLPLRLTRCLLVLMHAWKYVCMHPSIDRPPAVGRSNKGNLHPTQHIFDCMNAFFCVNESLTDSFSIVFFEPTHQTDMQIRLRENQPGHSVGRSVS